MVKFSEPIVVEDFNKNYAQNKKIKVKIPQEGMQIAESEFIPLEECTKQIEKKEVKAT